MHFSSPLYPFTTDILVKIRTSHFSSCIVSNPPLNPLHVEFLSSLNWPYQSGTMLFNTLSIHLTIFASFASAARIQSRPGNLPLLSTEETDFGKITIWGARADTPRQSATERDLEDSHLLLDAHESEGKQQHQSRCGSDMVICGGAQTAPNPDTCSKLIDFLTFFPQTQLGPEPGSVCLLANGGQCCVSWALPVSGLLTGSLVRGAISTYEKCIKASPTTSGLVRDVNLNGVCNSICLLDRPDRFCPNE